MSEAVLCALITGALAFLGVVVTNSASNKKMQSNMEMQQAITAARLEELTREVRMHNNFAQRVPVLEEQIKVANHRLQDLEKR